VTRALRKAGFETAPRRGKGSHAALTRTDADGIVRLVIVPERKIVPLGTLRSIIRQSGLTRDEFRALL
jgi:predicted RNA binding protein YcfA (HicA-like mRNA interferase family)